MSLDSPRKNSRGSPRIVYGMRSTLRIRAASWLRAVPLRLDAAKIARVLHVARALVLRDRGIHAQRPLERDPLRWCAVDIFRRDDFLGSFARFHPSNGRGQDVVIGIDRRGRLRSAESDR